jgi:hypothetical protein
MTKVSGFGGAGIQHDGIGFSSYENKIGTFSNKNDINVSEKALNGVGDTSKVDEQSEEAVVNRKKEIEVSEVENQINEQIGVQINVYA